jgi:hypothetical protein
MIRAARLKVRVFIEGLLHTQQINLEDYREILNSIALMMETSVYMRIWHIHSFRWMYFWMAQDQCSMTPNAKLKPLSFVWTNLGIAIVDKTIAFFGYRMQSAQKKIIVGYTWSSVKSSVAVLKVSSQIIVRNMRRFYRCLMIQHTEGWQPETAVSCPRRPIRLWIIVWNDVY